MDSLFKYQMPTELQTRLDALLVEPTFTDYSAAGNVTANTYTGKAGVALGATACVITNSLVGVNSVVMITPIDTDANVTKYKCVCTAGTITVTVGAATAADWKFSFFVAKR